MMNGELKDVLSIHHSSFILHHFFIGFALCAVRRYA